MLFIPLSLEFDVHTTGSAVIDGLGQLSVLLYDIAEATGTGSLAINVNS